MRSLPVALVVLLALAGAGCAGHDPLAPGTVPDAGPPPDTAPWLSADARPDLPEASVLPELGRDVRHDLAVGGSGLDRARPVASLSDPELGRLCDWGLGQLGGYGTTLACNDGSQIRNSPSREACIAGHDRSFRCTATVGDSEDCLRALATMGCSQALLFGLPACRAMFTCQRP